MPDSKDSCGHRRWEEWWKACTSVSPAPLCTSWGGNTIPPSHTLQMMSGCINIHFCLLLGYVPCCCPVYSALLYGFWVATSCRAPEEFLCTHGKTFLCSGLLFAQEKQTENLQVCDAELSCCVVGTTMPGGRRSQEEGERLGREEEED